MPSVRQHILYSLTDSGEPDNNTAQEREKERDRGTTSPTPPGNPVYSGAEYRVREHTINLRGCEFHSTSENWGQVWVRLGSLERRADNAADRTDTGDDDIVVRFFSE